MEEILSRKYSKVYDKECTACKHPFQTKASQRRRCDGCRKLKVYAKDRKYNLVCTDCNSEFIAGTKSATLCRTCMKVRAEDYKMQDMYGITFKEYENKLKEQNGKCGICGTTEPGKRKKRLSIDHDHETKLFRGLLCSSCNTGIGYLKDNFQTVKLAMKYLFLNGD